MTPQPMNIEGYEILSEIDRGGMAVVYLANDEGLSRQVAIKVMHSNLEVLGEDFVGRFRREAQTTASTNHPHIVTVHNFGLVDGRPYLVMEYLPSGSLSRRIKKGALDVETILGIGEQLADALSALHRKGIIHRDLKPDNILFHENGQPVLADFGIAKLFDADTQLTVVGTTMGTFG